MKKRRKGSENTGHLQMAPRSEDATMEQRIRAFYKQSGGPASPAIDQFMEKHLLFGKDHGYPGVKETIEDVFIDTVTRDPVLLVGLQWFSRWQNSRNRNSPTRLEQRLDRLEKMLQGLQQSIHQDTDSPYQDD